MLRFIKTGHRSTCPITPCSCASFQFFITGVMALVVGFMQAGIGFYKSMAVLTDAMHAIQDAISDFWGMKIEREVRRKGSDEKALRRKGDRIISLLMLLAAVGILHETAERFMGNGYTVSLTFIVGIGFFATVMDSLRWWILYQAQVRSPTSTRAGIILHVKSDMYHSLLIFLVGVSLLIATFGFQIPMSVLRTIDLSLSAALTLYMMYLSVLIWRGAHHHEHHHDHSHHHHHH